MSSLRVDARPCEWVELVAVADVADYEEVVPYVAPVAMKMSTGSGRKCIDFILFFSLMLVSMAFLWFPRAIAVVHQFSNHTLCYISIKS